LKSGAALTAVLFVAHCILLVYPIYEEGGKVLVKTGICIYYSVKVNVPLAWPVLDQACV